MFACVGQSETCGVLIPELEFELGMAMLGGKFTTVEGLLKDIKELVSIITYLMTFGFTGSLLIFSFAMYNWFRSS